MALMTMEKKIHGAEEFRPHLDIVHHQRQHQRDAHLKHHGQNHQNHGVLQRGAHERVCEHLDVVLPYRLVQAAAALAQAADLVEAVVDIHQKRIV